MSTTACAPASDEMPRYDNSYSRLVAWLKILLPLLALAILSTLFLLSRTIDPAQTIPFADIDIEELTRDQRIGAPRFTAVTAEGAAITLSAAEARPVEGEPHRIAGTDITAAIDLPDGTRIDVTAERLSVDTESRSARLDGTVVVTATGGYRIEAEDLTLGYGEFRVASGSGVRATGAGATLVAGRFELADDGTGANANVLVFKDRVKLVYGANG